MFFGVRTIWYYYLTKCLHKKYFTWQGFVLECTTNALMWINHFILALFLGGAVVQHGGEELQVQLKYDYITLFYFRKCSMALSLSGRLVSKHTDRWTYKVSLGRRIRNWDNWQGWEKEKGESCKKNRREN